MTVEKVTGWRKIAGASWRHPRDPQIYGDLEVDATAALDFIAGARDKGHKVTLTHIVGKALAVALSEHPDLNVRRVRGKFIRRETVSIFFIVSAEAGRELSGVKIEDADKKAAVEISAELSRRAGRIRSGEDVEMGRTKKVIGSTPTRLLGVSMRLAALLTSDFNIHLPQYGLPRQAFGSAMVSSVGMFGIEHAYAPLASYYRVPFLVLVGEAVPKPVALGERVEIRPMLNLAATLDHRYLDGFHAARLARSVRAYLGDPLAHEPPLTEVIS